MGTQAKKVLFSLLRACHRGLVSTIEHFHVWNLCEAVVQWKWVVVEGDFGF